MVFDKFSDSACDVFDFFSHSRSGVDDVRWCRVVAICIDLEPVPKSTALIVSSV